MCRGLFIPVSSIGKVRVHAAGVWATQTILPYLRPRATECAFFRGEVTISHKYCHHTHYYRTSNLYHCPVSSRLERSAPSTFVFTQRMLHQKVFQVNDA